MVTWSYVLFSQLWFTSYGSLNSIEEYKYKIKTVNINYRKKERSPDFVHLLSNMLKINENDRYSMEDVYNHPWFQNIGIEEKEDMKIVPINIPIQNKSIHKQVLIKNVQKIDNYFFAPEETEEDIIMVEKNSQENLGGSLKEILYSSLEFLKKGISKFSL